MVCEYPWNSTVVGVPEAQTSRDGRMSACPQSAADAPVQVGADTGTHMPASTRGRARLRGTGRGTRRQRPMGAGLQTTSRRRARRCSKEFAGYTCAGKYQKVGRVREEPVKERANNNQEIKSSIASHPAQPNGRSKPRRWEGPTPEPIRRFGVRDVSYM